MVWSTSSSGDRLTALGPLGPWSSAPPSSGSIVHVDFASARQHIVGFGGAFTESAAFNFHTLGLQQRAEVVQLLFGAASAGGNALSMGRVPINSADFALSDYSYANVTGDYALQHFDHALSRDALYVIPFLQAAQAGAGSPLKLFATPWSPPAWMKTPFGGDIPRMDGSTLPGLVGACNASWALYFSYWFTGMRAHGLDFWGYTPQNEPTAINATGVAWDACGYTAEGYAEFLRSFLLPVMQRDHPALRLLVFDHNSDHVQEWADVLYSDTALSAAITGTAIHWYAGSLASLNASHNAHPTKPIFHTEGCLPATGREDWGHAEHYAGQMLGFLQTWASSFNDWNLLLDTGGGPRHANGGLDAPIVVVNASAYYVQPFYYAFGHFSRFLPEGSVVAGALVYPAGQPAPAPEGAFWYDIFGVSGNPHFGVLAATMPNGTHVLVAVNTGDTAAAATLRVRSSPGAGFVYNGITQPPHSVRTITWEDM